MSFLTRRTSIYSTISEKSVYLVKSMCVCVCLIFYGLFKTLYIAGSRTYSSAGGRTTSSAGGRTFSSAGSRRT